MSFVAYGNVKSTMLSVTVTKMPNVYECPPSDPPTLIESIIAAMDAQRPVPPEVHIFTHDMREASDVDRERHKKFAAKMQGTLGHLTNDDEGRQYRVARIDFEEQP